MDDEKTVNATPVKPEIVAPPARAAAAPRREETQPCPRCGHLMPALKGGSASICPNCGFKDSCCY